MKISRSLISFALVAQEYEQHGDIVMGLAPLFYPIAKEFAGKPFVPQQLCDELKRRYDIEMLPVVAEELAPRLTIKGLMTEIRKDNVITFFYAEPKTNGIEQQTATYEEQLSTVISAFVDYAEKHLVPHKIEITAEGLENAFYERIARLEFISIFRGEKKEVKKGVLSLKPQTEETGDSERIFDFLVASFILHVREELPNLYPLFENIYSGALFSEVVLNIQAPDRGSEHLELIVYIDAPLILDLLGLGYEAYQDYATQLFQQLANSGVQIKTFSHVVDEIRIVLKTTLENMIDKKAFGPIALRAIREPSIRSYARAVLSNVEGALKGAGIGVEDSFVVTKGIRWFSESDENALSARIPYALEKQHAKEMDAKSIAGVLRMRKGNSSGDPLASGAIFVTRNSLLATSTRASLIKTGKLGDRVAPPCITDRYLSILLWIYAGGGSSKLSRKSLLANCIEAAAPQKQVIGKMLSFLERLKPEYATRYQAMMTDERCAHVLMELTLGDSNLLTEENFLQIYDGMEGAVEEKVRKELEVRVAEISKIHADETEALKEQLFQERETTLKLTLEMNKEREQREKTDAQLSQLQNELERVQDNAVRESFLIGVGCWRRTRNIFAYIILFIGITLAIVDKFIPEMLVNAGYSSAWVRTVVVIVIIAIALLSFFQLFVYPDEWMGTVFRKKGELCFDRELDARGVRDRKHLFTYDFSKRVIGRTEKYSK